MSLTPISPDEALSVKVAKKSAASHIADHPATYLFAFILCALPCFFLYVIGKALSLIFGLTVIMYVLPSVAAALAVNGLSAFIREFYTTGKRNYFTLCEKAFKRPLCQIKNASCAFLISTIPSAVIYFLPFVLSAGKRFHMICEIITLITAFIGMCFFMAYIAFADFKPKYVGFVSSFIFQIALSVLTKGVWLIFFIPHLLLSAQIYSKTNSQL